MRTTPMLWLLPGFLSIPQCLAAVTWRTVGCDNWSFQGQPADQIWDNAVAMTNQAQSQIDLIPTKTGVFSDLQKRAGANAEFIFGVNFRKILGLNSAGQSTMSVVRAMYGYIQAALLGTLPNLDVNNAVLFCGANGLVNTAIPDYIGGPLPIWHAEIDNGGTTEYITLSYITPSSPQPCTESPENSYVGKTFTATQMINNVRTEFVGIILCPNQWAAEGLTVYATLDNGYTADKTGSNKYPYIGDHNSMSGTLVHEMTHVVGRIKYSTKYDDPGVGFKQATSLAKTDQSTALINPDSYRLFAEMSMSPATQWGMPNPS